MSTNNSTNDLETLAVAALSALLNEVSVIKLKEIKRQAKSKGRERSLVAHIDVLGHSHTLACEINSSAKPDRLRSVLRDSALRVDGPATRVIIAPYISAEAQAVCEESKAGFIDLQGNARIALGEVFIGKRSMGARGVDSSVAASSANATKPLVLKQFPPPRAGVKASDYPPMAIPA